MKQILIIEDRIQRMEKYMGSSSNLLNPFICADFNRQLENIKDGMDLDVKLICIHRSILMNSNILKLGQFRDYCTQNDIKLILFTGGVTNMIYEDEGAQKMLISSSDFYTKNLVDYINKYPDGKGDIRSIAYGDTWELTSKLTERHKIAYNDFQSVDIDSLNKEIDMKLINS